MPEQVRISALPSALGNNVVTDTDLVVAVVGNITSQLTFAQLARALPMVMPFTIGDETTAITAGTNKFQFSMPFDVVLLYIVVTLVTAQTSGNIFTVDVNANGTSLLSTKLTIDNLGKTSRGGSIPAVISDNTIGAGEVVSVDVDQIGNGTAAGLKMFLVVRPSGAFGL